eukprot:gene50311-49359_t
MPDYHSTLNACANINGTFYCQSKDDLPDESAGRHAKTESAGHHENSQQKHKHE